MMLIAVTNCCNVRSSLASRYIKLAYWQALLYDLTVAQEHWTVLKSVAEVKSTPLPPTVEDKNVN
jgi:hypothetical protein